MNKLIWFLIITAYLTFLNGFAVATLWSWFVAPIFMLPILTIQQAAGLGILVSMMTSKKPDFDKKTDFYADLGELVFFYTMLTAIGLGIGWILS